VLEIEMAYKNACFGQNRFAFSELRVCQLSTVRLLRLWALLFRLLYPANRDQQPVKGFSLFILSGSLESGQVMRLIPTTRGT